MNTEITVTNPSPELAAGRRSGAVGAFLSFIFPGLGQAYLGDRKTALIFAAPVLIGLALLVVLVVAGGGLSRFAVRFFDPSVVFAAMMVIVTYGVWQALAVIHAWRVGPQTRATALVGAAMVALIFLIEGTAVFGYGLPIIASENRMFSVNPLDATPPPATPLLPGQTLDPAASPTQRPPDYVNPREEPTNQPEPNIEPGATPGFDITQIDAQSDGLLNVLLVGLDWQPGRTSKRTDTILVVSANSETGELLMFSFPRDTARFPLYHGGVYNGKINTFAGFANRNPELYPKGGMRSLAYEVGYLLGIPIDYYASVNMPGFMSVVEQVGGITVNNTRDIRDTNLQFYLAPGEHRLNPADALRYVRSRHGSGGDFGRAERQQQVLSALRREFLKPQNIIRLPDLVEALSLVISTDFPPGQIDRLVELADQVQAEPSESWIFKYPEWADHLRRTETGGRSVIFLRMDKIAALSIEQFGEQSLWNGRHVPPPQTP